MFAIYFLIFPRCSVNDNDNDFLTKWNESDQKYLHMRRWDEKKNNEDEWRDLECLNIHEHVLSLIDSLPIERHKSVAARSAIAYSR